MDSDGALRVGPSVHGSHRRNRRLIPLGFVIWLIGLSLWETSWPAGLATSVAGGAALTVGLGSLAGFRTASRPDWMVSVSVSISLILISQGVGQGDYRLRVVLVGLGALGMIVVFLQIVEERTAIERELVERTFADERRRLAGDVHDVVGHTLSASMLHMTSARLAIRSDPDAAIASLERAEEHGRRSMADIGSVVRLLRADQSATGLPVPGLDQLPALVDGFRAAGADITFSPPDGLGALPSTTALTVYRLVQEGLTNAARHGDGTIDIGIVVNDGAVNVTIENDLAAGDGHVSGGTGLAGMADRVSAIGGVLEAGPVNGRWRLQASIPT
jgi:signal transduction histidine kinase